MWMYNCYKVYKKPKLLYFPNKYWKKELEMSFARSVLREWMIGWSWTLRQMPLMAGRGRGQGLTGCRWRTTSPLPFSAAAEGVFSWVGVAAARRIGITGDLPEEPEKIMSTTIVWLCEWNFWYAKFNHFAKKPQLHKPYCTCGSMKLIFTWQIAVFVF